MTSEHPSNTLKSATGKPNSGFEINVDRFRALAQANAEWTEKNRLAGDGTQLGNTGATGFADRRPSGLAGRLRPTSREALIPAGPFGGIWEPNGRSPWGPTGKNGRRVGLGYLADLPDQRDHQWGGELEPFLKERRKQAPAGALGAGPIPTGTTSERFVHLSQWGRLPEVEDQGTMQSCTAHAVIGMAEYIILRHLGVATDLSRLFLYKCTRRILGWEGDTGAFIRTTIKALKVFGSLPESEWRYTADRLDVEPDAYVYAYAQNFRALKYARLDGYGVDGAGVLSAIKTTLMAGHPVAFGFPVYSSMAELGTDYVIPLPRRSDKLEGGHAVMAVGFNDDVLVQGGGLGGGDSTGALVIRNSWGSAWGDEGYAYLPYGYVLSQMAVDFWTLYGLKWLDDLTFGAEAPNPERVAADLRPD